MAEYTRDQLEAMDKDELKITALEVVCEWEWADGWRGYNAPDPWQAMGEVVEALNSAGYGMNIATFAGCYEVDVWRSEKFLSSASSETMPTALMRCAILATQSEHTP